MVTKKKDRVKVKKLKLNKETVKDLSGAEQKRVKGVLLATNICPDTHILCVSVVYPTGNNCTVEHCVTLFTACTREKGC